MTAKAGTTARQERAGRGPRHPLAAALALLVSLAFVGVACQDMSGAALHADFDYFDYRERPYRVNPFAD